MTAKLVDDITETPSDKDRESRGQGIANVVTGFFGGMAGCAMIGQTMINVRTSGARTRLSTFAAGAFLLLLVVGLGSLVAVIPMAALVAVMILVAVSTFDWHSVAPMTLRRMPRGETLIMVVTVAVTVATHNLAIGVGVGVLTAMAVFARERSTMTLGGSGRLGDRCSGRDRSPLPPPRRRVDDHRPQRPQRPAPPDAVWPDGCDALAVLRPRCVTAAGREDRDPDQRGDHRAGEDPELGALH